jgi:ribosomal protein S18 acetylase RimI-like enzyme
VEAARRATADDLGVVTDLARRGIAELEPQRGGAVWVRREARREPLEPVFRRLLTDDDHGLFVGTIDGVVVGYAAVHREDVYPDGVLAVIDDLYVEPDARAVGVGEALMDELVAWARGHSCLGIDALVLPGNRESKNFFETFGLTARAIVVHRSLDRSDPT